MATAARVYEYGSAVAFDDVPDPVPGRGDVLVDVIGCGVNPADWKRAAGEFSGFIREVFPIGLGAEFAGRIVAVGAEVRTLAIGDDVFGTTPSLSGAFATRLAVPATAVCRMPSCLSYLEASGVPVAALTAYQALHDHAQVTAGQRLLVHGAAGGVGTFVVQLARLAGAEVIATASAKNSAYVSDLGATRVIDYRAERFEALASDVDVVVDTVGGETERRSWSVLRPGGLLLALNPRPSNLPASGERGRKFFRVKPDQGQLTFIAGLFERSQLKLRIERIFPFSDLEQAFALSKTRHLGGKIVLDLAEPPSAYPTDEN